VIFVGRNVGRFVGRFFREATGGTRGRLFENEFNLDECTKAITGLKSAFWAQRLALLRV
jgi:hypothetical protein